MTRPCGSQPSAPMTDCRASCPGAPDLSESGGPRPIAALWGEPEPGRPAQNRLARACIHRGAVRREESCPTCRGRVHLKVFDCFVYGECTVGKALAEVACCHVCPTYDPGPAPQGPTTTKADWQRFSPSSVNRHLVFVPARTLRAEIQSGEIPWPVRSRSARFSLWFPPTPQTHPPTQATRCTARTRARAAAVATVASRTCPTRRAAPSAAPSRSATAPASSCCKRRTCTPTASACRGGTRAPSPMA